MAVRVVQIVDENGVVREAFIVPPGVGYFYDLDEDFNGFNVLVDIDPWGDTILNNMQTRKFIVEWDRRLSTLTDMTSLRAAAHIRTMAEQVVAGRHLYLKFQGD